MHFNFDAINYKTMGIVLLSALFMFATTSVIAASGSTGLDDSLATVWTEISSMATGNTGRILMMLSLLGVVIFAVVQPNLLGFAACGLSLIVLSNATDFIEGTLAAGYNLLPQISSLL